MRERDRLLDLVKQNLVSRSQADQQIAAATAAEAGLHEAESALRELQEGTRTEQLTQARQAADSARASLRALETTSARLEVRAPIAGRTVETEGATLELGPVDWSWQRRLWAADPACGCCWAPRAEW